MCPTHDTHTWSPCLMMHPVVVLAAVSSAALRGGVGWSSQSAGAAARACVPLRAEIQAQPAKLTRAAILRSAASVLAAACANAAAVCHAIPPPDMLAKAAEGAPRAGEPTKPMVLYTPPSIKGVSTPEQLALAEHLKSKGAKFYGAYWCQYCYRQRQMFGAGGSRALPYIECAPDGYDSASGTCRAKSKDVTGYPTWEIGGKFYGGMRTLRDLQALSEFDPSVTFPEYVPPPPPPRPKPPKGGYRSPTVETASNAEQLALARHLSKNGAKFYGAYWCKFCNAQRSLFGAEAAKALPYIECDPEGYRSASGTCQAKADVKAYPTWEIGGQFYSGMKSLDALAKLSGFEAPPAQLTSAGTSGEGCSLSAGAGASENCK